MTAMCTRGTDVHSRPLPSFVTRTIDPVSATPKLHPGDAEVGAQELGAQLLPGERGERRGRRLEHATVGDLLLQELRGLGSGRGAPPGR